MSSYVFSVTVTGQKKRRETKIFNPFTRDELQGIKSRARYLSETKGTNPEWVRLYQKLGDAASHLDAFIARTEVKAMPDQHAPSRNKERK